MIIIEATSGRDWPHLGISIKPGVNKFATLPAPVLTVCEALRSGRVIKMTDTSKAKAARASAEPEPELENGEPSDDTAAGETAPAAGTRKKRRGGRSRADLRAGVERANGSPGGGE
jgi:hypothetical protein